jgi:hypothetical protein
MALNKERATLLRPLKQNVRRLAFIGEYGIMNIVIGLLHVATCRNN